MLFRSHEITFEAAIADLKETRWQARAQAAAALATCEPEDRDVACHALLQVLADSRGEVRYAAVHSLGELRDVRAVPPLLATLEDADPLVRQAAIVALGRIGEKTGAWDALLRVFASGDAQARFHAVAALAALDPVACEPQLITALADSDSQVRANAACALAEVPASPESTGALALLLLDAQAEVRFEAALTLSGRGDSRAVPVLLSFLDDRLRSLMAAEALSGLKDPRSTAPLLALLSRYFVSPLTKVHAAHALMLQDVPEGRSALLKLSRSLRPEVRNLAQQLLGE